MSTIAPALGQRRLMTLIVLVGAAFVLFFPARQLVHQRQRISSLESRLVQVRAENESLSQDVERLSDPEELEVLARERLGLVNPGERAYFVEAVKPKATGGAESEAPGTAWWERAWESLTALLRGGD